MGDIPPRQPHRNIGHRGAEVPAAECPLVTGDDRWIRWTTLEMSGKKKGDVEG